VTLQRLRLVFVVEGVGWPGPADFLLGLLPRLAPGAFSVIVVVPGEPGPGALRIQKAGAMVHSLGLDGAPGGVVAATLATHRLVRLLRNSTADLVHGLDARTSALGAVAGRIAGVPVLIGTIPDHGAAPAWARRAALRRLDHIVVPTDALRVETSAGLGGRHPGIRVVPPGVDPDETRGCARPAELFEPKLRVGVFARLEADRGVETLLAAAALLRPRFPDLEWLVLGGGRDALRYLASTRREGLGNTVRLLGEPEDVAAILTALDACAVVDPAEALPSGLLRAMAAGVPCVAAGNPSTRALLAGTEAALLVEAGDPAALGDAVARIVEPTGGALRARLRDAGPPLVAPFGADRAAARFQSLYQAAALEARTPR
jgi:glycosyltransferase involved in cell wall biosynthesis